MKLTHLLLTACLAFPSITSAADISIRTSYGTPHIHIKGPVHNHQDEEFEQMLIDNPEIEWVSFDSQNHGELIAGLNISELIQTYLMSTVILPNDDCGGVCKDMFVSGHKISIYGDLYFTPWEFDDYSGEGRLRLEKAEARHVINDAQLLAATSLYNQLRNGFSWDLHRAYHFKDPILMTKNADLEKYYIGPINASEEWESNLPKTFVQFKKIAERINNNSKYKDIPSAHVCGLKNTHYTDKLKFKDEGTVKFYKNATSSSESTDVPVLYANYWTPGNVQNNYVYLHSGNTVPYSYGWVDMDLVVKQCKFN